MQDRDPRLAFHLVQANFCPKVLGGPRVLRDLCESASIVDPET
jgi:hypothetical protein